MPAIPDWARAWGAPLIHARLRAEPDDFVVVEKLDVEFTGDGEHDWLLVEKTGANTQWVARQLARHAGVPERDVGFSGLKDRHAVTTQWFSVRRQIKAPTDWSGFDAEGVRMLEKRVHNRKLKRGAHSANAFRIVLRSTGSADTGAELEERLATISRYGVPNYFGEQRFGHDGANVELGRAVVAGRRVSRMKRSIGLSALRSLDFNADLSRRVEACRWDRLEPGGVANLDGSGSVFDVEAVTPELEARCSDLDIHPAGMLPGLPEAGVKPSCRATRMRVHDLAWEIGEEGLRLAFSLGRGCYATAVLRELASWDPARA